MENTKEFILEDKELSKNDGKSSLKSLEAFKENPFAKDTIIHADKGYKMKTFGTDKELADVDTGEVQQGLLVAQKVAVDKGTFVKIFVEQMEKIYDLPKYARKMFQYIAMNIEINSKL